MTAAPPGPIRFADLGLRVASGLALAAVALLDIWLGGVWFTALGALACVLMLWEFHRMITGDGRRTAPALIVLASVGAAAVLATGFIGFGAGLAVLAAGALIVAVRGRPWSRWLAAGLGYIGVAVCYLVVIRHSEIHGLPIILWLFLVVVATDVGAYFAGRTIGGAKLWPAVSPSKTWAGAIGGLVAALLVGLIFGLATDRYTPEIVGLSFGVSIAAQLGDILESALKRRCYVKDSSRLIPGHGGVMDRLDGLLGGLWFFAIYDIVAGVSTG